jgi:lipopolysaccharide export system protein LptC
MYRGRDNQGRPFSLMAGSAVQRSSRNPVVMMQQLTARILLKGGTALLEAGKGDYDMATEKVQIDGPVRFSSEDGYRLVTRDVEVDLKSRKMQSNGRVTGRVPAGTFSADQLKADLEEHTVTLDGRARLTMQGNP